MSICATVADIDRRACQRTVQPFGRRRDRRALCVHYSFAMGPLNIKYSITVCLQAGRSLNTVEHVALALCPSECQKSEWRAQDPARRRFSRTSVWREYCTCLSAAAVDFYHTSVAFLALLGSF